MSKWKPRGFFLQLLSREITLNHHWPSENTKQGCFVVVQNEQEQVRMLSTGAKKIFMNAHFFLLSAVVHL